MLTDSLLRDPAQLASATSVPPLSVEGEVPKDRNVEPSARCDRVVADVTGLFALPADLPVPAVDGERVRRLIKSRLSVVTMTDRSVTSGRVRRKTPSPEARGDTPALGAIRGVERHQRPVIDREVEPVPVGRDAGCRSYGGRPANLPGRGRQRVEPVARDVCVAIDHGWGVEVGLRVRTATPSAGPQQCRAGWRRRSQAPVS